MQYQMMEDLINVEMATNDAVRPLKIKSGVIKRLIKEIRSYEKEDEKQRGKIQKLKDDNACPHDIAKQEEVLGENSMMFPDCSRRIKAALDDLTKFMDENKEKLAELSEENEDLMAANEQLKDGKAVLEEFSKKN